MKTKDSNRKEKNSIFFAQYLIIGVAVSLMIVKFFAYYLTNSNAILTDALESIVNVVSALFGLYSLHVAFTPADENHPYGHGKIEFLSSGLEGVLITTAGLGILFKSVYNLFYPQIIDTLDVGIILTTVAGLVNLSVGLWVKNKGIKENSIVLKAGGKHLLSDAWSSVALVVGLILVMYFDNAYLDSILALGISLYIIKTGWGLVRQSIAGIMDEADYKSIEKIISILSRERKENWVDIHNFRIIKYGSNLHADCHVSMPYYLNVKEAHFEVDAIEEIVNRESPNPVEWFIHIDPCTPNSCKLCIKSDCPVRSFEFEKQEEWTLENITKNQQHHR